LLKEIEFLKPRKQLYFFVDDNITANHAHSKALFRALIPLKIKWVGQTDISITGDDELLDLMVESGCQGVLIGFESLSPENLKLMNKSINQIKITPEAAIRKIHEAGIIIYGTFLHGYDQDKMEDYKKILNFCIDNKLFMVGFNHVTPFPGTGLYQRLADENRLLSEHWWLDEQYTYGAIPFKTRLPQDDVENQCRNNRKIFFSFLSILKRMGNLTNIKNGYLFTLYLIINFMLSRDASTRKSIPLGDAEFRGELLKVIRE
jgi:radical SAM superfamily enzyme YgiQ (UPF0313 family)